MSVLREEDSRPTELSDADLVAMARDGRREGRADAFATLLERHRETAARVERRVLTDPEDVEDVLQEAALAAYLNLPSLAKADRFLAALDVVAKAPEVDALLLVLPDHLVEPGHAVGQGGYFCRVLTVQLAGSKFELGDLAEDGVMDVEINVQWAGHGCSSRRYGRQCSRAQPATERTDRSCRTRYRCKEGLRDT